MNGGKPMRATLSAMAALAVVFVSELAWACPVCAQREEPGSLQWFALGALVVLPWFVVGGAAWWMKRSMQQLSINAVGVVSAHQRGFGSLYRFKGVAHVWLLCQAARCNMPGSDGFLHEAPSLGDAFNFVLGFTVRICARLFDFLALATNLAES